MSFLQPWMLLALPLVALPIVIHLINQWRFQSKYWGAMMFLLAANRTNRGMARVRQWLILALRTLAVAGLILAVARPLSSGVLGWGGGSADTTILLIDRSASMQARGTGGRSKLQTVRFQLLDALGRLNSRHWVVIDSVHSQPREFDSVDALARSSVFSPSWATANIPHMLLRAVEYIETNEPGATEIWICSDLQQADWRPDDGAWRLVRDRVAAMPQPVRIHLLTYPDLATNNQRVQITRAVRAKPAPGTGLPDVLKLSFRISRDQTSAEPETVPVRITIDGVTSQLDVRLEGAETEVREQEIPLPGEQATGWVSLALPTDANPADDESFAIYTHPPVRRALVVTENRESGKPLEIAASVAPDGQSPAEASMIEPADLASTLLPDVHAVFWAAPLPDDEQEELLRQFVGRGGQVVFFPPENLTRPGSATSPDFMGVRWKGWLSDQQVEVENWRSDQDLLAATRSGMGLPVGTLNFSAFAILQSDATELIPLATLTGGYPMLARLPTEKGGVYFCAASPDPRFSSLATSGIVLYVIVQRVIDQGQQALQSAWQRVAGNAIPDSARWSRLAGPADTLSTEYAATVGVFRDQDQLIAVNRSPEEDQMTQVNQEVLDELFSGLTVRHVQQDAGSLSGIVREVWRVFLLAMIVAMLGEAVLSMPRHVAGVR